MKKKRFGGALLEALLEIIVSIVALVIGALVLALFGVDFDSPNMDGDLLMLLGLVAVAAVVALITFILKGIKWLIARRG